MAKFKDLHLLLQEDHRILFGDDSLGVYGPLNYPATNLGSEKPFIAYTTISGYNTTLPGLGISNIAETDQLVMSVPVAGERGTQPYHLVRFDQLQDAIFDEVSSDWQDSVLTFSGTPPGAPSDGERYIVDIPGTGSWTGLDDYIVEWNTASGTWETYAPNEGFTTFVEDQDKYYLYYNGAWAPMGEGIDHGDLIGLEDDDHTIYVLTDGSRGFTATVSGVYPSQDYHLSTKEYVDDQIATISGFNGDHGSLTGLDNDDHTQYILVDGTRGFTGTVSGIDPTASYHLTTKWYVDDEISTLASTIITDHGGLSGLGDDDHTHYTLSDGTRGFTGTVSGIAPTVDDHLTTKWYVDDAITTATGSLTSNHGDLTGLDEDDHPQYTLVDGSRGFTNTISGIEPTDPNHLTTKQYVDDEISTLSGAAITDHGDLTGLDDDDHPQYILEDGTRAFSGTVSGIYPTELDHLTTKEYVDDQFATQSGTQKWGRISCIDGNRDQAVTFDTAFPDDSYTVVASLTNEVDAKPSIYSTIQGVKAAGGFTTHFSGKIDSSDYILEWFAFYGQQS